MKLTLRQIVVGAIPTVVALLGFLWFRRKKKDPQICWEEDAEPTSTKAQNVQRQCDVDSVTTETLVPPVVVVAAEEETSLLVVNAESVLLSDAKSVSCDDTISTTREVSQLESQILHQQTVGSCNRDEESSSEAHVEMLPTDNSSVVCNNLKSDVDWSETIEASIEPDSPKSLVVTSASPIVEEELVVAVSQAVVNSSAPPPELPADQQLQVALVSSSQVDEAVIEEVTTLRTEEDTVARREEDTAPRPEEDAAPRPEEAPTAVTPSVEDIASDEPKPCQTQSTVVVSDASLTGDYSQANGHDVDGDSNSDEVLPQKDVGESAGKGGPAEKATVQASHPAASSDCDQLSHSDITDAQSEVSSDSGRGASGIETPTATSPSELSDFVVYEFDFPSEFCGKLIGKSGKNINSVKAKTGAEIILKRKPFIRDYQNCCIEGTQTQVQAALENIRRRFPPKQFNNITYKQTNVLDEAPVLAPEIMQVCLHQLSLPVGVSVDCVVSSVVQANHIFVQQPTHPTFSSLESLNYCMNACYTQDSIVPQLPRPIDPGVICAAPVFQGWYRAQVMAFYADTDDCDIKYVDYGGYMRVPAGSLRQIRSDFATLPFQAVECYLANVMPLEDQEEMGVEASVMLESLVQGQMLQAQITQHEADGVPYVQLYNLSGAQAVFVNRELVDGGVACWVETQG